MGFFDFLDNKMYLYTQEQLDAYQAYIRETFGEIETVFQEIDSLYVRADVIVVPPTPKSNYYKMITMGMGAYEMNVMEQLKLMEFERAELILYLPPEWEIGSEAVEDSWPIDFMKKMARLPARNNTWVGWGHTFSDGSKRKPFAKNTRFSATILIMGKGPEGEELDFRLPGGEKINFYQVVPIYPQELRLKERRGEVELIERLGEDCRVLDLNRKNVGELK